MFLGVLVLCSQLASCSGASLVRLQHTVDAWADAPATLVRVFSDGMHSGLVLPRDRLPIQVVIPDEELDRLPTEVAARYRAEAAHPSERHFIEIGYSEYRWSIEEQRTLTLVSSLLVRAGDGVVMIEEFSDLQRSEAENPAREWVDLRLSPESFALLQQAIIDAIDDERPAWAGHRQGRLRAYMPSRWRYRLDFNCHDFTARLLRRAGVPVAEHLYRTPGVFSRQLASLRKLQATLGTNIVDRRLQEAVVVPPPRFASGRLRSSRQRLAYHIIERPWLADPVGR